MVALPDLQTGVSKPDRFPQQRQAHYSFDFKPSVEPFDLKLDGSAPGDDSIRHVSALLSSRLAFGEAGALSWSNVPVAPS
jgi:hypothetical protein